MVRGTVKPASLPNPDPSYFTQLSWDFISDADDTVPELKGIVSHIKGNLSKWK